MTPTLRTLLLAAVLAVGIACDALAVLLSSPAWALAGQLPLVALLLWVSHELEAWRRTATKVERYLSTATAEADKPPLTQDDYAALLRGDAERVRHFPVTSDTRGFYHGLCGRSARLVSITHPIWDGPFDGAGSGVVDRRLLSWCVACEGAPPSAAGRPVRLPYLDTEPIALLPELFGREAFTRLGQRVTQAPTLPPMPTHAFDGRGGAFCDVCGYAKDDPRHAVPA